MDIFLSGNKVDVTNSTTHLCIVRDTSGTVGICSGISLCRKTAYLLMGGEVSRRGGLVSGMKTAQNGHVWTTFVVPRLWSRSSIA